MQTIHSTDSNRSDKKTSTFPAPTPSKPAAPPLVPQVTGDGHLEVAQWLTETFGLAPEDARPEAMRLGSASPSLQPDVTKPSPKHSPLVATMPPPLANGEKGAFLESVRSGNLEAAKLLAETFSLKQDENNNRALQWACRNGHVEVAMWLSENFGLTPQDARANNNEALTLSCEHGHLEVARWLTNNFHLTTDDARSSDNAAFRAAIRNGHLEVAKWIAQQFSLSPQDVRANQNEAFRCACRIGHLAAARWLTQEFKLNDQDARCVELSEVRSMAVAQWLGSTFQLKK